MATQEKSQVARLGFFQLNPPLAGEIHLRWMKSLRDEIPIRGVMRGGFHPNGVRISLTVLKFYDIMTERSEDINAHVTVGLQIQSFSEVVYEIGFYEIPRRKGQGGNVQL